MLYSFLRVVKGGDDLNFRAVVFQLPLQGFDAVDFVVQDHCFDLHILGIYTGMHNSTLVPKGASFSSFKSMILTLVLELYSLLIICIRSLVMRMP